jgi:hypothetical protein
MELWNPVCLLLLLSAVFPAFAGEPKTRTSNKEPSAISEGSAPAMPKPVTDLSALLHSENVSSSAGRSVEFANIIVRRVFDSKTFLVGQNADKQIVVRLSRPYPKLRPGQQIQLTGVIRRTSEFSGEWPWAGPNVPVEADFPVFIDATSMHVLGR